jgi:hypothetical protein
LIAANSCDKLRKILTRHINNTLADTGKRSMRRSVKTTMTALASLLFSTALVAPMTHAAGTDELWEITTKMEMPGIPMAMPAQTNKFCKPQGQAQNDPLPSDKNNDCKMTDMQRSGSTSRFKMVCTGKQPMTGEGEVTYTGADSYSGKMHIAGKMEGESIDMTQTFSGKKVGNCTYEDLGKKAVAQAQAATADMCNKSIEQLSPYAFDPKMAGDSCAKFKPQFCARARDIEKTQHTPAGYTAARKNYQLLDQALELCGISRAGLMPELCQKASKGQEWDFLVANCPAEAKVAAQEHCAGRDYTSAMSGPYAPLCRSYAQQITPAQRAAEGGAQSTPGVIKDGVKDSLKKLLPF